MAEFKGEKLEQIWIGNQHVASIREEPGHEVGPFVIESVDGKELHQVESRHLAEVWVTQHADDIVGRLD